MSPSWSDGFPIFTTNLSAGRWTKAFVNVRAPRCGPEFADSQFRWSRKLPYHKLPGWGSAGWGRGEVNSSNKMEGGYIQIRAKSICNMSIHIRLKFFFKEHLEISEVWWILALNNCSWDPVVLVWGSPGEKVDDPEARPGPRNSLGTCWVLADMECMVTLLGKADGNHTLQKPTTFRRFQVVCLFFLRQRRNLVGKGSPFFWNQCMKVTCVTCLYDALRLLVFNDCDFPFNLKITKIPSKLFFKRIPVTSTKNKQHTQKKAMTPTVVAYRIERRNMWQKLLWKRWSPGLAHLGVQRSSCCVLDKGVCNMGCFRK